MSAFRMNLALRSSSRAAVFSGRQTFGAVRSFQSSRIVAAGKESKLHEEGRPEEVEAHKHDSLNKQKEGKGHWKDELASDSESIVKADRNDVTGSTKQSIEELQKETAALANKDREGEQKTAK